MVNYVLNSKKARVLFEENAICIRGNDILTEKRANMLFEKEVIDYASRVEENKINAFGIIGFNYLGFINMVTLHNVRMINAEKVEY